MRRLRLASGLVLFSYVFLHFLNHSLGNISYEVMVAGAVYAEKLWRGPVGGPLLYGAFAIHLSLAFWAIISAATCGWAGSRGCVSASAC